MNFVVHMFFFYFAKLYKLKSTICDANPVDSSLMLGILKDGHVIGSADIQ